MKYRILIHVDVDVRDDQQATEQANKLGQLLKNPMVKMAIASEGIRTAGEPVVYRPTRSVA